MDNIIYVGNGILDQIKEIQESTYNIVITKKSTFDTWMNMFKDFYKEYPYSIKWDYEKFLRKILDYYDD